MARKKEDTEASEETKQKIEMAHGERPTMDVGIFIQLLAGAVGTIATSYAVRVFKGKQAALDYIYQLVNNRGPLQFMELFLFFMCVAFLIAKSIKVRRQARVITLKPINESVELNDDEMVQDLRTQIEDRPDYSRSIVLHRINRMLTLWLGSKDIGRVSGYASSESSRDSAYSDSTYSLLRVNTWAIPIMGFIGTVQGLGFAVSSFSTFLQGEAELSQIKGAIGNVTAGLGTAFDTTFLALILVSVIMFPLSGIQRREENFFVELDNYLEDSLMSRFPAAESQPIVIQNLEDAIEAGFRRYIPDPDRYDEVFTRSIEKAAGTVEQKFTSLSVNYQGALNDLAEMLSASASKVGDGLQGALQAIVDTLKKQEDDIVNTRRSIANEELDRVKTLIEEAYGATRQLSQQYFQSMEGLQKSTADSARNAQITAEALAGRLADIGRLAEQIQGLVTAEQTISQSLDKVARAEEFRSTMAQLSKHLETTDAFCARLSKPRVIMFREGPA